MVTTNIQPITIYLGVIIMGLFTGIGVALGEVIVEVWIKPRIEKWKELQKKISEQITKKPDISQSVIFKTRVVQEPKVTEPVFDTRTSRKEWK